MTITAALAAGLLSFFSACIIPLIPSHLAMISGLTVADLQENNKIDGKTKLMITRTSIFIIGLIIPLVILGMSASVIGSTLAQYQDVLTRALGLIVIFFGLALTGVLRFEFMQKQYRSERLFTGNKGKVGTLLMGMAFGFAWTPCSGPFLGSTLALASQSDTVWQGGFLLLIYGLGLGIPFLLIGLAGGWLLQRVRGIQRYIKPISIISGILMIILGLFIVTGNFVYLSPIQ